jgi:hypothetical protein
MHLVHSITLKLREFTAEEVPVYAILSHTWGKDEVSFQDMRTASAPKREGYAKIKLCAKQADLDGLQWIWVDTCCIDKSSSAELSEAINSMYHWYKKASVCYVYLSDATRLDASAKSRWFSRGWTLQELIAPSRVEFFGSNWCYLGSKRKHLQLLSRITGIDFAVLNGADPALCSISRRMSWASGRQTTRPEDMAYCLMGVFDVNMPLLYGEGDKAFIRLQQEIMKDSDDHTLFTWEDPTAEPSSCTGFLAHSPNLFSSTGNFTPLMNRESHEAYSMTNKGLSLKLLFIGREHNAPLHDGVEFSVLLDCCDSSLVNKRAILHLKCLSAKGSQYTRIKSNRLELTNTKLDYPYFLRPVNVKQTPMLPVLQAPLHLRGVRVDSKQFTESTGMELLGEYPQPVHEFLNIYTHDLDYRAGPFGILGFGHKDKGLDFAIILGFKNFMGPCCKIVRHFGELSYVDELRIAYEHCQRDSMITLAPNDKLEFPEGDLRAVSIWKEEQEGEAIVGVFLQARQS